MDSSVTQIFALSGSLSARSKNTGLLRLVREMGRELGFEVIVYPSLGAMPPFNPDIEQNAPAPVLDFRSAIQQSRAVIISSPEYAHGVSGVLKNSLDWIVGSGEIVNKPTAVFNASPRAQIAHEALLETLRVMNSGLIAEACMEIPVPHGVFEEARLSEIPAVTDAVHTALARIRDVIQKSTG